MKESPVGNKRPGEPSFHLSDWCTEAWLIFREAVRSFVTGNDLQAAASLTYYGLFASIPFLLLSVYFMSRYLVSSKEALRYLERLATHISPEFHTIVFAELTSINRIEGLWGAIGFLSLLYAITPLPAAVRYAFYDIFKTGKERPFLMGKLRDLAIALLIIALLMFLVVSEIVYTNVVSSLLKDLPGILSFFDVLVNVVLSITLVGVFYYFFLPVQVPLKHVLGAAVFSAFAWALIRPSFAYFITINPRFGFAFGSLKALYLLFLWIYISFCVILFGAELIAHVWREEAILIKNLLLNATLSDRTKAVLVKKYALACEPGQVIFRAGDDAQELYYVLAGAVHIVKEGVVLSTIEAGRYFGELAIIAGLQRSADALAAQEGARLVPVSKASYRLLLKEEDAFFNSLLSDLSHKLISADEVRLQQCREAEGGK